MSAVIREWRAGSRPAPPAGRTAPPGTKRRWIPTQAATEAAAAAYTAAQKAAVAKLNLWALYDAAKADAAAAKAYADAAAKLDAEITAQK